MDDASDFTRGYRPHDGRPEPSTPPTGGPGVSPPPWLADLRARTELHPATAQILRWFTSGHLPAHLAVVVSDCYGLAERMAEAYPAGGPELTAGLRHLLEAKDCFVRAAIVQAEVDARTADQAPTAG